ncbi:hypothetical protein HAPAU_20350 [Halalkalicoccus paucihalophilus]|uniref:DUF2209 domain-containing protein n=1 Tax=Halalkalicoccus paucihalophilus TaxID=1008153 RepID=A0A151ACJ7_9EURY|nr:DUF2209 family protein [Halalkalicoccus paucihalophilus]KYH25365.1 hypothetical protein HAPAU_20350 [Halalkalicoccus paucihalophilus]
MVGIDISGRHEERGEYLMVAAAVAAGVGSNRIHEVTGIGFATSRAEPALEHLLSVVEEALGALSDPPEGPVVAERGEFYEEPATVIGASFGPKFKYVESVAERRTVEIAHHAAYAARTLIL